MESAQVTAHGRVNGMGEKDDAGSYVAVSINSRFVPISEGAAEQLIAELQGSLAQKPEKDDRKPFPPGTKVSPIIPGEANWAKRKTK